MIGHAARVLFLSSTSCWSGGAGRGAAWPASPSAFLRHRPHRRHVTVAGYARLADDHLVLASERVGSDVAEPMALTLAASNG